MEGDQLEDADGLVHGIEREADGPGDPPVLARDQVARAPGLELEDAVMEPHRPEDLAVAHPPPLDAEQGGVAFRRQFLHLELPAGRIGRRVLVHDRVRGQGAVLQGQVGQRVDLGDDPRVVLPQLQRVAEVADEQGQALALAQEPGQGQEADDRELVGLGDSQAVGWDPAGPRPARPGGGPGHARGVRPSAACRSPCCRTSGWTARRPNSPTRSE